MLTLEPLGLEGVMLISPKRFFDERGFFSEVWSRSAFEASGLDLDFVQDNHSWSKDVGTLRGLHFQSPPFAQDKLVRVTAGRVLEVVVDLRRASPTYGQHLATELSAKTWQQLLVPKGFAHGFCTLEPDTEFLYKVTAPYAPEHDHGVLFSDPDLGIAWPFNDDTLVVSQKDLHHPPLSALPAYF